MATRRLETEDWSGRAGRWKGKTNLKGRRRERRSRERTAPYQGQMMKIWDEYAMKQMSPSTKLTMMMPRRAMEEERERDWSVTDSGPPAQWSESLLSMLYARRSVSWVRPRAVAYPRLSSSSAPDDRRMSLL
jgi:hypothetical protein